MATNKIAYFPNVASVNTKTVGATTTGAGTTVYTAPAASNIRVRGFTVSLQMVSGGATNDYVNLSLKIGTGYFNFALLASTTAGVLTFSNTGGSDIGFEPSFLQVGDTITTAITSDVSSGSTYIVSVSLTLEDFTV